MEAFHILVALGFVIKVQMIIDVVLNAPAQPPSLPDIKNVTKAMSPGVCVVVNTGFETLPPPANYV